MKKIQISQILSSVDYIEYIGNNEQIITSMVQLNPENTDPQIICWSNDKNIDKVSEMYAGTVIISKSAKEKLDKVTCNLIITENPRNTFGKILDLFFIEKRELYIAESAKIAEGVKIGKNPYIGENVVIEKNCEIGDNCVIMHNTVVFHSTIIGNQVIIGANNTIGGIGFGYEKDKDGLFTVIPHIGNVILENKVEIGNNTCIDRAVLGSTILEENVKVDNLVHIAHGVVVKRNAVVIANAMIAGSVEIGENCWIAPSASVLNQKKIGDNSLVGMGAVVLKDVGENEIYAGNPAKFIKKIINE